MRSLVGGIAWTCLAASLFWAGSAHAGRETAIADGMTVTLEYTLSLPDATVVDSNVGDAPISYLHGAHEIVPGLERALTGMKAGDSKRIEVAAIDGYGAYDMKKRMTVEKSQLPDGIKDGDLLESPDGQLVRVVRVGDTDAVIDTNHPLAGKNLTFDVKVLKVDREPQAPAEK